MWFALSLLLLLVMVGGAVDIAQARSNKAKLQNVADAAALASIQGDKKKEMRDLGMYSVKTNSLMDRENVKVTKIKITPGKRGRVKSATVDLTAEHQTAFLGLAGLKTIQLHSKSVVERSGSDTEIALVVDISFSMAGSKITKLKSSAQDFVDIVMGDQIESENVSMNIVPFGGNVNLGNSVAEQFMPNNGGGDWDPSDKDYTKAADSSAVLADNLYRFTGGTNCIETKLEDYNADLIPAHSRSQLPSFIHANSRLPICPEESSSIIFNSSKKADLKYKIDQLELSHGTAMDVGAAWGLKALSPAFRNVIDGDFSDRPHDFNSGVKKILIIMTDGNITGQGRTRTPNASDRFSNPKNMKNKRIYDPGDGQTAASTDNASGRFKTICDSATANNVTVYTIGFRIDRGGSADQLLDYCATSAANYYFVENLNLSKAFNEIAKAITETRIVQ